MFCPIPVLVTLMVFAISLDLRDLHPPGDNRQIGYKQKMFTHEGREYSRP